jgi:hypothetical protein
VNTADPEPETTLRPFSRADAVPTAWFPDDS